MRIIPLIIVCIIILLKPKKAVALFGPKACAKITVPVKKAGNAHSTWLKGEYRSCTAQGYWDGYDVTANDRKYVAQGRFKVGAFKTGDVTLDQSLTQTFARAMPKEIYSHSLPLSLKDWNAPAKVWRKWNIKGRQQTPQAVWVNDRLVNAPSITRVIVEKGRRIAVITTTLKSDEIGLAYPAGVTLGDSFTVELRLDIGALRTH